MKKLALHWQILLGMAAGVIFGLLFVQFTYSNTTAEVAFSAKDFPAETQDLVVKVRNLETKELDSLIYAVGATATTTTGYYGSISSPTPEGGFISLIKPADQAKYGFSFIKGAPDGMSVRPNNQFVQRWIKPFGTIFINALKLIAIPLIVASLIMGIANLKDISKLSKMGGRTIGIYLLTTVMAVSIGIVLVNLIKPGSSISEQTRTELMSNFEADAGTRISAAQEQADAGPLQALIDLVPDNIIGAATSNGNMLQVIFFAIFFGIGLILIDPKKAQPVVDFFDGVNEVILKLIDLIMMVAPYGVFALLASLIVESPSLDLFKALGMYALTVLVGLSMLILVLYPLMVRTFTGRSYSFFFKGISPAQLLAFSTSSSAATLPVTMERVEEHLGVDEEVTSFVLPIGATINMDGTSLYQAVAAVFIAQAFGMELSIGTQLGIVATASLASIGSAAVPGAGMVMLVIVLAQAGIPEAGLALIFAVDRPLDMCRTVANVTGDATVSMLVAKSVDKLGEPHERKLDDHYNS